MGKIGRDFFPLIAEGHTPTNTGGQIDLTPSYVVSADELKGAIFVTPTVGVVANSAITFGGTYAVGDDIRITVLTGDDSRQAWRKSYQHTVQPGATALADIVQAFYDKINLDQINDAPYAVAQASPVLTVSLKNDDTTSLNVEVFTNSSAGTIAEVFTAATVSEGQPQDLIDAGIPADQINLASYDTVRIDLHSDAPIASIDSVDAFAREIYWFGTPGEGAALETLINSL